MLLLIVSDRKSTVTQTGREAAAAAGTPPPAGRPRSSSLNHGELQPLQGGQEEERSRVRPSQPGRSEDKRLLTCWKLSSMEPLSSASSLL